MENALKLEYTEDEKWRPRGLFLPGFLGALALLITGAVIRFFRPSGSRFSVFFGIILLGFAGICLWGFVTGRGIPPGKSSGVLRETAARRVPDPSGAVTAFFREGPRVSIRPDGGSWVWVEAPDAAAGAGWVPRSDVIFY
jgi:hypothetical protein